VTGFLEEGKQLLYLSRRCRRARRLTERHRRSLGETNKELPGAAGSAAEC
jgi:hypothetical protein